MLAQQFNERNLPLRQGLIQAGKCVASAELNCKSSKSGVLEFEDAAEQSWNVDAVCTATGNAVLSSVCRMHSHSTAHLSQYSTYVNKMAGRMRASSGSNCTH